MNNYTKLGLYPHNINSYEKIKEAFLKNNVVSIVHATGTGKTYNALQLVLDNADKKVLYVVPSLGIMDHIKNIIESSPNIDIYNDFSNLDFRTYQSFTHISDEELENIDCDLLILDEFHHIGAPVWGEKINKFISTHPNIKIFGMTAYTVRDRGTPYERDMANEETEELFSNTVASRYDLCEAMIEGVLPKPIYKSAHINLIGMEQKLEEKVKNLKATSEEYQEYMRILKDVKKRIEEAPSIPELMKKNLKKDGKYIYFCPPILNEGMNSIDDIIEEAKTWFYYMGLTDEDFVIYKTTSSMRQEGKLNQQAFYNDIDLEGNDVSNKLKVMFAINQYNEGIHSPNIDGVIMGRNTVSDIVYFEQLGRALSVRGDTTAKFNELENYSKEELILMCQNKDIQVSEELPKSEIIEKLIAPIVIDLTNNYSFIKDIENNLKLRIREKKAFNSVMRSSFKITDASFDIDIINQDLFETLKEIEEKFKITWNDYYALAKIYYEHNGNLYIPIDFKTKNGYEYDENGFKLGKWARHLRDRYINGVFSLEICNLLKEIGFTENISESIWQDNYALAKKYYEYHNNLDMTISFKTKNGYEYDEDGFKLGQWLFNQRKSYRHGKMSKEKIELLEEIGFIFEDVADKRWKEKYELAKTYYEYYGNLEIPHKFKTKNGYEYDKDGVKLGIWLHQQVKNNNAGTLDKEYRSLLEKIGFESKGRFDVRWKEKYELAKAYYQYHGNALIPGNFNTENGYEYKEDGVKLGAWLSNQKQNYKNGILTKEHEKLLREIGVNFGEKNNDRVWQRTYKLVKAYYEHYGDLNINSRFKTVNGYEYDDNGTHLGAWIRRQNENYINGILSLDRQQKLESIGMVFDLEKEKQKVKKK